MSQFRDLLFGKSSQISPIVRAPKYLEYINQSGVAGAGAKIFITDHYVSSCTEFEIILKVNSTQPSTISNLLGSDNGKIKLSYDATNQAIQLVVNDFTSSWLSLTPDVKHTIKYFKNPNAINTNSIFIDGTNAEWATVTDWSDSGLAEEALHILGVGSNVTNYDLFNLKVWYNDGTNRYLQHNYIPIIDYNNVLCMYDTEYEEHLYAQGVNSTLTASTNQYTQVEYLDWTGTTPIECEFYNPKSPGGNYGEPIHFRVDVIAIPVKTGGNKNLGGFKTFNNSRFRVVYYNTYGQNYYMGSGGSAVTVPADVKNQISYVFDMEDASPYKQSLYNEGEERTSSVPTTTFPGYGNWYINFSNPSYAYIGKIYQYKITDYSHDNIYDYRSCKNQGGVAGVFNIYTATFIDCSASAVAGPEKQIPATQDFLFKKTQDDLYIDTTLPLYYPELKVRVKNYDNNNNINLGSYDSTSALQIYTDSLGVGTGTTTQYLSTSERSDVVLDGLNGKLFINDIEVTGSFSVVTSNVSPYVFKIKGNTSSSANRGYFMFCEVKNNDITIRKLIPSYNPNDITKIGLYDPIRDEYMEASDASFDKFEVNGTPVITRSVRRISPYYCTLNYLRSTGTQFIDTGIKASDKLTMETKVEKVDKYDTVAFGAMNGTNISTARYAISWVAHNGAIYNYYGSYAIYGHHTASGQGTYGVKKILTKPRGLEINDVEIWSSNDPQTFTTTYNVTLFTTNLNGSPTGGTVHNLYYCKMWLDGVIIREYIPVLDWNMRPALYDLVNETFNYNVGTGEFLYG